MMVLKIKQFLTYQVFVCVLVGAFVIEDNDPHKLKYPLRQRSLQDSLSKYDNLAPIHEREQSYWTKKAANAIKNRASKFPRNMKRAKNIIMFLGDGMSLATVTAARILKGQRQGRNGEEALMSFETFPYVGLSKTYCANAQVPDSACTATAYLCGVKTNIFQIGLNAKVNYNNCSAAMDPTNQVSSIAEWAQAAGKATGIITTTTVTHASPSGAYAHVANRQWECDSDVRATGEDPSKCMDIAKQLITQSPGRYFDVVLGGGMGKFLPKSKIDSFGKPGEREDHVDLLTKWLENHPRGKIIDKRSDLLKLNKASILPTSLLGVFQSGFMKFHAQNDSNQPTLAEMTEVALKILSRKANGYFIFIEGGRIDHGHHLNKPGLALDEALEMDKAVLKALEMTDPSNTLIVVTADHSHAMSIAGYPGRGNDILNLNEYTMDADGLKYATLNYAVGPEQYLDENGKRIDLTGKIGALDFIFPSYITADLGVHGGTDVGIYAYGPGAHMFSSTMEQNVIPMQMAYAACIGNGPTICDKQ